MAALTGRMQKKLQSALDTVLGVLTSLTTTAKTTLVAALNELDADVGDKSTLTTTAKTSLVAAANELDADVGDKSTLTTTAKTSLVAAANELDADVGDKSTLTTTAKTSLVAAANELDADIGDLTTLDTTAKGDVVAAVNEVVRKRIGKVSVPIYATANGTVRFGALAIQQAMTIQKISVSFHAVPVSTLGTVTLAVTNYDLSATTDDNLLVAATFDLEGLTDKETSDLTLTATGADLVLQDGDFIFATIISNNADMTAGTGGVLTVEFLTDEVKEVSVPVYATANSTVRFGVLAVQRDITITGLSVAFHTKPASTAGAVTLAVTNYDLSATTDDNLLSTATVDLEGLTDKNTLDLTLTATPADLALQDGDFIFASIVSDNADMTDGVGGTLTVKFTVG